VWLKGTRFVLRRRAALTERERTLVDELADTNERVYRGWLLVDQLRAVYQAEPEEATLLLDQWLQAAGTSALVPFVKVATPSPSTARESSTRSLSASPTPGSRP
jgi:transposase